MQIYIRFNLQMIAMYSRVSFSANSTNKYRQHTCQNLKMGIPFIFPHKMYIIVYFLNLFPQLSTCFFKTFPHFNTNIPMLFHPVNLQFLIFNLVTQLHVVCEASFNHFLLTYTC